MQSEGPIKSNSKDAKNYIQCCLFSHPAHVPEIPFSSKIKGVNNRWFLRSEKGSESI